VFSLHDEFEASPSHESIERRGRWTSFRVGRRQELSREALEREAAAEMGLTDGPATLSQEVNEVTEPNRSEAPTAPEHRTRKPWSRIREALSTEADAARRERLEREAAEELGLTGLQPDGVTDRA
jgi:hypothetical protein